MANSTNNRLASLPGELRTGITSPYIFSPTEKLLDCLYAKEGKAEIEALLQAGADVSGSTGQWPLLIACQYPCGEIAELLVDWGTEVNCQDNERWTPLHHAAFSGWRGLVQSLLKMNIDVNAKTRRGDTPLNLACFRLQFDIAELLLAAGADYNSSSTDPFSPICVCVCFSRVEPIKLCIANGGCIELDEYDQMLRKPLLKEGVLQDERLCSRAIINKFNLRELVEFYQIPTCAEKIPGIEHMEIGSSSQAAQDVEKAVALEIREKGHCNLREANPIVLKMLCVKSFLDYYRNVVQQ